MGPCLLPTSAAPLLGAETAKGGGGLLSSLRDGRIAYNTAARDISDQGLARIAAGEEPMAVAEDVVDARNELKVSAREGLPSPLGRLVETRNTWIYGNPVGPTVTDLLETRTPLQIVEGAGRTNGFINWLLRV